MAHTPAVGGPETKGLRPEPIVCFCVRVVASILSPFLGQTSHERSEEDSQQIRNKCPPKY